MSVLVPPPPPGLLRRWAEYRPGLALPQRLRRLRPPRLPDLPYLRPGGCSRAGHDLRTVRSRPSRPAPSAVHSAWVSRTRPCSKCALAGLHVEPLRHFIHLLKYEGRPDLAPDLARYLAATLAGPDWQALWPQIDAISPVPLHTERRRQRGYDQAELLAQGLSARTAIPLRCDLVERTRQTRAQVGLNATQRHANMHNAFAATGPCTNLHVLLIDDVYTTGATMRGLRHCPARRWRRLGLRPYPCPAKLDCGSHPHHEPQ